jgi:hypothetical protein
MQPTARSPLAVRVLSGLTRILYDGTNAASRSQAISRRKVCCYSTSNVSHHS